MAINPKAGSLKRVGSALLLILGHCLGAAPVTPLRSIALQPLGSVDPSLIEAVHQRLESTFACTVADLLRAVYFILSRNTPYRDLGVAFFDRLDTTKATANLVRRLRTLGYDVQITPAA